LDAGPVNAETERLELVGLRIAYAVFLLTAIGRIGELIPGLGSVPLAKISMGIGVILLIAVWKRLPKLNAAATPFARTAFALVGLAVITAPFSIWPGMTLLFFTTQLPVIAAAVVVCCKISYTWDHLRGIMRLLVGAAVGLAFVAMLAFHGGRASVGNDYDTNDLAYVLVTILPLALAFTLVAKTKAMILVNAGICILLLAALLLTSSRGGLFGLVAMLAVLIAKPLKRPQHAKPRNRIVLPAIGLVCASMLAWACLPAETQERLSSVLQLTSDYNLDTTNRDSRSAIWERGFSAVLQRPVGYGVHSYEMVDVRMGGKFRAPHNSYLQVLVELGVLGLLFFSRMYLLSWRALQRMRRHLLALAPSEKHDQMLVFGRMLQVALVGNAVSGFFLSMAYSATLWVLFAAVIACVSLVAPKSARPPQVRQAAPADRTFTTSKLQTRDKSTRTNRPTKKRET
jgi:O-antigen ligase